MDLAVRKDMYVLADWHILNDSDPNENADEAAAFFERISSEYKDCPNLIFEICNEPNGSTDWGDVLSYCDRVIPVIRANLPDAVILVGTSEYDRNLGDCLMRPLPYDNVMYVLHFYTATHHEGLFAELNAAVDAGLPVFISECGISEASGDVSVTLSGVVVGVRESGSGLVRSHTVEILDFRGVEGEYWQILYDRIPTLPQSLHRDFGVITHLWQNIAHRVARTGKR